MDQKQKLLFSLCFLVYMYIDVSSEPCWHHTCFQSFEIASYSLTVVQPCRHVVKLNDYHKVNTIMDSPSCWTVGSSHCWLKLWLPINRLIINGWRWSSKLISSKQTNSLLPILLANLAINNISLCQIGCHKLIMNTELLHTTASVL